MKTLDIQRIDKNILDDIVHENSDKFINNNNGKNSNRKRPNTGSLNGRLVQDRYKT